MMYKAKVAVCSEIHTKHSTQSEHHEQFLNFKPCVTYRNRWGLKGQTFCLDYLQDGCSEISLKFGNLVPL